MAATVVFSSSKGGAGKTTAALMFGFVMAQHGITTTIIDADPNKPIAAWAERDANEVPPNMKVVAAVGDEALMNAVEATTSTLTIIDLEGSKNSQISVGIGWADLVIVPMMGSRLDVDEAITVVKLIKNQERAFNRPIPYRVMVTRATAVNDDRYMRDILEQLDENGITRLKSRLLERAAYRATFHVGKALYNLTAKDTRNVAAAIENAEAVANEIYSVLAEEAKRRAEKTAAPAPRPTQRKRGVAAEAPAHV